MAGGPLDDPGPSTIASQSTEPARITSNVKRSLKLLKIYKAWQDGSMKQEKPSTSYRRQKVEKKSLPEDFESHQDPATKVYESKGTITIEEPVLLVDGYNVCGAWPKLKKHFARGELMIAREKLISELMSYSTSKGIKVVVAFDAAKSGLPTHKETRESVDVVFVAERSADYWIEHEVCLLKSDGCPNVKVVTCDNLHRQHANGAGAFVWSCKLLISEVNNCLSDNDIIPCFLETDLKINDAKKEVRRLMLGDKPYSREGRLLEDNLSPHVFNSLQSLKQRLKASANGGKV